jgi:CRP/FNR family cyclic AMP-dependent transcriptional regulator
MEGVMEARGSNIVGTIIENSPIFKSVDFEHKEKLKAAAYIKTFAPEDVLIEEGGIKGDLFLICTGKVRVEAYLGGREVVLAELVPGDVLGEVAAVTGVARTSTVTAVEPVEVVVLPESIIQKVMNNYPKVRETLMRMVEDRAMDAISKI